MLGFYQNLTYLGEEKYLTPVSNSLSQERSETPNTSSLQPSMWEKGHTQPQVRLAILAHLKGEKRRVKSTWKDHFPDRKQLGVFEDTHWLQQAGSDRGWGQSRKTPVYVGILLG